MTPGASAKFYFPFELSIVGNLADTENLSVLDKSFDVLPKVSESMTLDKIFPFVTVDSLSIQSCFLSPLPKKPKLSTLLKFPKKAPLGKFIPIHHQSII